MKEAEVRLGWNDALNKVKNGTELSMIIEWSFYPQDLLVLCCLHESGRHQEKIEDLLEDCNFHTECGLLCEGNYDECREVITSSMI